MRVLDVQTEEEPARLKRVSLVMDGIVLNIKREDGYFMVSWGGAQATASGVPSKYPLSTGGLDDLIRKLQQLRDSR